MGLIEENNGIWLSLSRGKFVKRTNPSDPKAQKRINKNGEEVWESTFSGLEGKITNMYVAETDYGQVLNITMADDDGNIFKFNMPTKSGYFKAFMNYVHNIDFNKPVQIKGYSVANKSDSSKTSVGVTVYQDGEKVAKYFYDYDGKTKKQVYRNNFPQYTDKKFSASKYEIYKLQLVEFLTDYFAKNILPKFDNNNNSSPEVQGTEQTDEFPF